MLKENAQATDSILKKNEGKIKTVPGNQKTRGFPTNNPSLEKSLKDILEKGGRKREGEKKKQQESSEIRLIIKETGKDAGEAYQMLSVWSSKVLLGEILCTQAAEHWRRTASEFWGGSVLQDLKSLHHQKWS